MDSVKKRGRIVWIAILILFVVFTVFASAGTASFLTGFSTFNQVGKSSFKDIDIKTDFSLEDFKIELENADIRINSGVMDIEGKNNKITLSKNINSILKEFSGYLEWRNNQLVLDGNALQFTSENADITWNKEKVKIILHDGNIDIISLGFNGIETLSKGLISISDKVNVNLENDKILIEDYQGSFAMDLSKKSVKLDGKVSLLEIKTEKFKLGVN